MSARAVIGAAGAAVTSYEGCIVARRRLRFRQREALRLPVALHARCEGVPCDGRAEAGDASLDAETGAPFDAGTPGLVDGKTTVCDLALGDECCNDPGLQIGTCKPSATPCNTALTACDGSEDCAGTDRCHIDASATFVCLPAGSPSTVVRHSDASCPPPLTCVVAAFGHYGICQ
ncbi:MAG: hypothetical protein KF819_06545 [Labilithrix sp.]|nr:hypothetical protein [Labilithrix sp.]